MKEGWKCPVCEKGNAPFAIKCGHCEGNKEVMARIKELEDDSLERVVIEGVRWQDAPNSDAITPRAKGLRTFIIENELQDKPPMKMILEILKEEI